MNLYFDPGFDPRKVDAIAPYLPATYAVMNEVAQRHVRWPKRIECMTPHEIRDGERRGAGHGIYYTHEKRVKVNPHMGALGIFVNIIHENAHHAFPRASEQWINRTFVPYVFARVMGRPLPYQARFDMRVDARPY